MDKITDKIVITPIKRHKPGPVGRAMILGITYLLLVPINWLMGIFDKRKHLLSSMIHSRKSAEKAFKDYCPDLGDVFVCTYPKSGTNWMMQMAHQIIFHGEGEYENILDVISWPDMGPRGNSRFCIPLASKAVQQLSPEHKRVIKTHLSTDYVPYNEKARYIVVIRDPKEVFVSSYHFVASTFAPLMPSPKKWFELYLTDAFPLSFGSSWAKHAAGYWALHDKPNVLILSYAGMKKDLPGTISKVAEFLGVDLSPAAFARVQEKCTFAYMKKIDEKFIPMPKGSLPWGDMEMMREGKSGNSSEMISMEQQRQIDAHFRAELTALGSTLPYEEFARPAALA